MLSAPQHQDAMKMAHVIRTLAQIAFTQGEGQQPMSVVSPGRFCGRDRQSAI